MAAIANGELLVKNGTQPRALYPTTRTHTDTPSQILYQLNLIQRYFRNSSYSIQRSQFSSFIQVVFGFSAWFDVCVWQMKWEKPSLFFRSLTFWTIRYHRMCARLSLFVRRRPDYLYTNISISNMYTWNIFSTTEQWLFNISFHFALFHNTVQNFDFNFNKQPNIFKSISESNQNENILPIRCDLHFYKLNRIHNTYCYMCLLLFNSCDSLFQNKLMNETPHSHCCWR